MYQLEKPIFFYLLFAIVGLMVLFLLVFIWKRHTQNKFAPSKALRLLSPDRSFFKSWIKVIILSLAIGSLALALVNPKIGTKIETISRAGVDVVFALDVSKSMLAEDIAPNRLDKSKQLITQIINSLGGDRVGIIGYAGSAFPQVPITTDFSTTKLFLNSMDTDMAYTYRKGGVYYFSKAVPQDLADFYARPRIVKSLRTKKKRGKSVINIYELNRARLLGSNAN